VSGSSSSTTGAVVRRAARLAVLCVFGCGREDIELASPPSAPPPADDCGAQVPLDLAAARPPMGWNGYNAFGCDPELDEAKVTANVDALIASGMMGAGYHYVNLDACWELPRSADGGRRFDPEKLPSGIEALSADIHARGLSLGVFAGDAECYQTPSGSGHEVRDAESYAAWGVDYVKYVHCAPGEMSEDTVAALADALAQTGRPMVLSLAGGVFYEWMREVAQVWRTGGDAQPTWSSLVSSIDSTVPLAAYARPGGWNDPDALSIGNGNLTAGEKRVQFSVWSILSAPLLAGNDLSTMDDETRDVLTNDRLIALNQDPLGLQAALIRREGDVDVLAKPLAECGARAVVFWNRGEASAEVSITWEELWLARGPAAVHELWSDAPLETGPEGVTVAVAGHDAVALRVTGIEPGLPSGRTYLSDLQATYVTNGYGPIELDRTNGEDAALDGGPIRLRGAAYAKGLGVHAPSLLRYRLGGGCSRFVADVGIDDDQGDLGSAEFEVWADGERLFRSGVLTGSSPTRAVNLDVSGRRELRLFVGVGGDDYGFDHAVWAGARVECGSSGAATE
jgi:alpha-galactosidase